MEKEKEEEYRMSHTKCFCCNDEIKINSRQYIYCQRCELEFCDFCYCSHSCHKRRRN